MDVSSMRTRKINGLQLEKMMRNGLANLRGHETEVNKLNVFPVADGDTGTNMCSTLENGIKYAKPNESIGHYSRALSEGMLLGARGNSGVILSQFFKGFSTELARCSFAGPGELRNALIRGYRTAYESVVKPVEGTILTVTREGIEHIRSQITRYSTTDEILSMYVAEMKKTLSYTPEMLDVLKESGVVDSGAQGMIYIFEGMLAYLYGNIKFKRQKKQAESESAEQSAPDFSLFDENSRFELGYCTEFILQLLHDTKYSQRFELKKFIAALQALGDSLVVVQDGKRVKVHIHTLRPERVIALARGYGEFLTFKLENMQLQHNEVLREESKRKKRPHKALAMVAVVNGEGLKSLFEELGCDVVICCGETMNASSQEFVDAFDEIDADDIVVFPNNKNVFLAAQQAVELHGGKNIHIIPSRSVPEGYFSIAMDVPDRENSFRISSMESGLDGVATLIQTTASRDYSSDTLSCREGDDIVLLGNELVCASGGRIGSIIEGMKQVEDIEDKETCVIFSGEGVTEEEREELEEAIEEAFPLLDAEFIDGGQRVYRWLLGLS